jgi:predicted Mrr-cat superfamily restriction endonuclease
MTPNVLKPNALKVVEGFTTERTTRTNLHIVWPGRLGETTEAYDLAHGTTSILWDQLPDLRTFTHPDHIADRLTSPTYNRRRAGADADADAGSIWRFYDEIQPGDWIIMPKQLYPDHFAYGLVCPASEGGAYTFNPRRPAGWHTRGVLWGFTHVPNTVLAPVMTEQYLRMEPTVRRVLHSPDGAHTILLACQEYRLQQEQQHLAS